MFGGKKPNQSRTCFRAEELGVKSFKTHQEINTRHYHLPTQETIARAVPSQEQGTPKDERQKSKQSTRHLHPTYTSLPPASMYT